MATSSQILKKIGKVFLWVILSVLVIVIGVFIFINTSSGKEVVKNQVVKYLSKKLQTTVTIGAVDYSLPKWLEIKNV